MVVVTLDVPAAVLTLVVVVVAAEARELVAGLNTGPRAPGVWMPTAVFRKLDEPEPIVVGVMGCTGVASGVEAPANGNGLKMLIPVAGVIGALPMMGDGLNVVGEVASGADAPKRGNGLNTLPPVVTFVVTTVVCCTVTAPAWTGINTILIRRDAVNVFMVIS